MKLFNLQLDDDLYTELSDGAKTLDTDASKFVRAAIREKLARDVYGVVSVPTAATARANAMTSHGLLTDVGDGLTPVERMHARRKAEKEAKEARQLDL